MLRRIVKVPDFSVPPSIRLRSRKKNADWTTSFSLSRSAIVPAPAPGGMRTVIGSPLLFFLAGGDAQGVGLAVVALHRLEELDGEPDERRHDGEREDGPDAADPATMTHM